MTEIDRILSKGFVDNRFLDEETIDGFFVEKKRKRIWLVALDLLYEFDKVCKKHELKYFLAFGSMLGAIRHKGFIPWDDDIDVAMSREDYDILITLGHEFNSPYFLQVPDGDESYYYSYTKLRNSNTSCVSKKFRHSGFNSGMMIDIFPYDKCDYNLEKLNYKYDQINSLNRMNSEFMGKYKLNESVDVKSKLLKEMKDTYKKLEKLCIEDNLGEREYRCFLCFTLYPYEKTIMKKEWIQELTLVSFCGKEYPIPCHYDEILSKLYGNYMQYPPVEDRGTWHNRSIFDPDMKYTEITDANDNNL